MLGFLSGDDETRVSSEYHGKSKGEKLAMMMLFLTVVHISRGDTIFDVNRGKKRRWRLIAVVKRVSGGGCISGRRF